MKCKSLETLERKRELCFNETRGITLIALIITIIVILILAGVIIATLTGDNGLLKKASSAKETSIDAEIEETIRLAWNKVYSDVYLNNYTDIEKANILKEELEKMGYTDENTKVTANGMIIKIENYRGRNKILNIDSGTIKNLSEVTKAIKDKTVFDNNTTITDEYDNKLVVPKGFKIASDSAEVVTEGIVIEDATYTNTIGSQFVWIPVSIDGKKIIGPAYNRTMLKESNIILGRYEFNDEGNIESVSENFIEENPRSAGSKNEVAKNIGDFIAKTNKAGGFYIGRYEARTTTKRNSSTDALTIVTEKATDFVYNYIKQGFAAEKARKMYINDNNEENNNFETDLVNSYAWDTTILFLQEYGENIYSRSTSVNTDALEEKGTTIDKVCNVYDMASNCIEYTTESSNDNSSPCVLRGGTYNNTDRYASSRIAFSSAWTYNTFSFRPVLYIK